jgi:hypothetical protein
MTNIRKFPSKAEVLPPNCADTESYLMQEILYNDTKTRTVVDFTSGSQRNRRWGIVLALAVVPGFDQVTPNMGPTLLPRTQSRFFTADTVDELRNRVLYEIDKAIAMAKMSIDDPEEFTKKSMEAMSSLPDEDGS